MKSNLTTLCYITRNNGEETLFIVKKRKGDPNMGKWLGIGGHFEENESEYDCVVREIYEETGIKEDELLNLTYRGIITFVSDIYGSEYMHVFSSELKDPYMELQECDEGELVWYPTSKTDELPLWEGDKTMFKSLREDKEFFSYKMVYEGDKLVICKKNK